MKLKGDLDPEKEDLHVGVELKTLNSFLSRKDDISRVQKIGDNQIRRLLFQEEDDLPQLKAPPPFGKVVDSCEDVDDGVEEKPLAFLGMH